MRLAYFVNVKFFGTNFGTKNKMTSKKALISRLLPVDLAAPYRARTCDPWIKSPLLYQLS